MTRYPRINRQPAKVAAPLPTSRYADGQELSILARLRNLAPRRTLDLEAAEQLAEDQAAQLLRLARLTHPPTPTALITELPRVMVHFDVDLPASGGTHWINGRWLLLVNGAEPQTRQRFSLAHEYKHALDHRYRSLHYQPRGRCTAEAQAELAADEFAAALLMPRAWVLTAWNRGTRRLSSLAELFDVSPQAMARRLQTLGIRPTYGNHHIEAA